MLVTGLTRFLWWAAARMGLCLANVGDSELQRLLMKRLRWTVLAAGSAGCLAVLANGVAAAPPPPSGTNAPVHEVAIGAYVVAGVTALIGAAIWLYARRVVRRAIRDRAGYPVPVKGTVRNLIAAQDGGWVVRLRGEQGRWIWLTGSPQALAPLGRCLDGISPGSPYRLSVTVTYYSRCRVIYEVTGMAVEQLGAVLATSSAQQAVAERPGYPVRPLPLRR